VEEALNLTTLKVLILLIDSRGQFIRLPNLGFYFTNALHFFIQRIFPDLNEKLFAFPHGNNENSPAFTSEIEMVSPKNLGCSPMC
jgi:hypothetical protein